MSITTLSAQVQNFVWMGIAANYAGLIDNQHLASPSWGGGGSFGLGYELHNKHLLFHTGIEGGYYVVNNLISQEEIIYNAIDSEGDRFLYIHDFHNRNNQADMLELQVPLMLGGQFGNFYFLAGPRLNLLLKGSCKASAKVNSSAQYEELIGVWHDMENHSLYTDRPINSPTKTFSTNIGVRLAVELGYVFNTKLTSTAARQRTRVQYRLGAFAEYGLLNLHKNISYGDLLSYENTAEAPGVNFDINYIYTSDVADYTSDVADGSRLQLADLLVGVRLTMLFGIPEKKKCVICRW